MKTTRPAAARTSARPAVPPPGPLASFLVACVVLAVYAWLAPPVAGDKDSSEFILVLARLGTPHPTGYPIYTLLGHLFVSALHAFGVGWARAGNVWSAVGGAAAMGLLHALAARLLAREGVAARAAGLLACLPVAAFALNPLVTMETTLAEVNAFHLAWVMGAMLVTLVVSEGFTRADAADGDARRIALAGFVAGLGLAHHATSVFVIAPLSLALVLQARAARRWTPALLFAGLAGVLPPLAADLWTAWRTFHPVEPHWQSLEPSWAAWWRHVSGAEYRIYLGHYAPSSVQQGAMATNLWPWFVPCAALALLWAVRARHSAGAVRIAWLVAIAATTAYARSYGVPDPSSYFLPPFLLAIATVPAALAGLASLRSIARPAAALAGLALLVQSVLWFRVGLQRREAYVVFEMRVHAMWRAIPFTEGFVLWPGDMIHRLHAYQWLDGEKPGLEAINPIELTHERPHAAFVRRHGFDPADRPRLEARLATSPPAGAHSFPEALGLAIVDEINAHTSQPVVLFRPEIPQLMLLDKPGADTTRARR